MYSVKNHNRKAALLVLLTAVASVTGYAAPPRLLVGIVVDGLQTPVLEQLRNSMSRDGFNAFLEQGVVAENVDFGTYVDAAAATAIIQTGAAPALNGIDASFIYHPETSRVSHIFADDSRAMGNYTDRALTPAALLTTTLADEARISGAGVTYVHAIATDPAQAIILGGHAANSAIWLNTSTGNWASSTFYGELPTAVINTNRLTPLAARLDTASWTPVAASAPASNLPDHLTHYPFRHTFARSDANRYVRFSDTPLANNEITRLAKQYLSTLELGNHPGGTDVLNLAYTLRPYNFTKTPENRYELYDSYLRLDNDIASLLTEIDNRVGRQNAVIFITGTPPANTRRIDQERWNIPSGEFSSRKAISLLNLYLIALHGNGQWVTAFHNGHFYLNNALAESQGKDIRQIRQQTTDFLRRMAGVSHAYTIDDILEARPSVPYAAARSRNTVTAHSGDAMVDLLPGWVMIDDYNNPAAASSATHAQASQPPVAPFMILAPDIKPRKLQTPVDARAIAPTISGILHIRPPNGATTPPMVIK